MRADMAKVIVERPRLGGITKRKGYWRQLRRYDEDDLPRREGIKEVWKNNTKGLNEHLGPLRRYLDSQVGRPWDKVFSEICTHINRNSAVQDHVRDHVEQYVAVHVISIDGVLCHGAGGWSYGKPLTEIWYRAWYVCPRTGLLRKVKGQRRRRCYYPPPKKKPHRFIRFTDTLQCRLIDGAWHLITLKPLPVSEARHKQIGDRDILLGVPVREITPSQAWEFYGAAVYAVARRPLSRRELSQYPVPASEWKT